MDIRDRMMINEQRNIEEEKKKKQKNERRNVIHLHSLYIFATTYGPIGTCYHIIASGGINTCAASSE